MATVGDAIAMELLCDAYMEYRRAREVTLKKGSTYTKTIEVKFGRAKKVEVIRERPEVRVGANAWKRLILMLKEFGLTPASRTKVETLHDSQEDELDRFLNGLS